MGLRLNISDASFLIQRGYGNIKAAQSLADVEKDYYDPHQVAWLMNQGQDYFQRSFRDLNDVVLKLRSVEAHNLDSNLNSMYSLASQALELGVLFVMRPEAVERRKELIELISQGLSTYQDGTRGVFNDFIKIFAAYTTRDISLYEQSPVVREINLNGMRVLIEDHPTYTLIHPKEDSDRSQLFVSIPHNGTQLPPEDHELRQKPAQVVHSDSDLYLNEAWSKVPEMGGTLMIAKIGRFACDLNRTRKNATGLTVEGREAPAGAKGRNEAIWPETMSGDVLRQGRMTEEALSIV